MATEAASSANGVYDNQHSQPAELAASMPSQSGSVSQNQSTPAQQKADPQEIGWYFVEQYYTTLSKTPERIHLFYSKRSQLVTGVEAEKVVPAVGTRAISEKIKALDIQDCKVRVLNVDSQSSFENIVVQVIGEMSNKSQPHHKFVQTFVLATQPNGYFVLNDIFRYLNEDEDEIVEDQPVEEPVVETAETAPQAEEPVDTKPAEEVVDNETAAQAVDEKLEEAAEEPATTEEETANGLDSVPIVEETAPTEPTETVAPSSITIPEVEQPLAPEPTPVTETPAKATPEAPPAKKTWASLVGNKAPAIPALPVTNAPAPSQPKKSVQPSQPVQAAQAPKAPAEPATTPTATSSTATAAPTTVATSQNNGWQTADHGKKAKAPQTKSNEGIVHAYIKNVTEKVDARILREVLEKYGELKYYDVSRPRNCAFVEFADPAGYLAAVAANPHDVGGESIAVEERRPRPGQFGGNNNNNNNNNNSSNSNSNSNNIANFNRGGSSAGRGRGSLQGRTGSQGGFQKEGRGGFAQRGGKPGNVTPKGRGQTQTA